jgi:hypothetical protein
MDPHALAWAQHFQQQQQQQQQQPMTTNIHPGHLAAWHAQQQQQQLQLQQQIQMSQMSQMPMTVQPAAYPHPIQQSCPVPTPAPAKVNTGKKSTNQICCFNLVFGVRWFRFFFFSFFPDILFLY